MTGLADVSVFDASGWESGIGGVEGSLSAVTGALQSLGVVNEDPARYLEMASGALQIVTGMLGIAQVLKARVTAKTAQESAKAAALVAANSWNPVGWTKIGIAAAATAVASVGMYALVRRIQADLSTPTGRASAIRQATGGSRWRTSTATSATSSR